MPRILVISDRIWSAEIQQKDLQWCPFYMFARATSRSCIRFCSRRLLECLQSAQQNRGVNAVKGRDVAILVLAGVQVASSHVAHDNAPCHVFIEQQYDSTI